MVSLLLALHVAPDTVPARRYHYRVATRSSIDASTGGAPLVMTMTAFIAMTLHDSASGQIADIRIYSSAFDAGAMATSLPPQLNEDPRDVTLHGYFVNGRMISLAASSENLRAMRLMPAIQLVMTSMRRVQAGETWSDTTVADSSITTASTKSQSVSRWSTTRRTGSEFEFQAAIGGTGTHRAGSSQLTVQNSGTSRLVAKSGDPATTASTTTTGRGALVSGATSQPIKVTTELSAALFPTAAWAQIP